MSTAADLVDRTVAVVLAGGKGKRLDPLTRNICKPALPFGAAFRCIDFSLSNCVNSGVRTIGVATQYEPDALLAHLWNYWNCAAVRKDTVVNAWRAEERAARFGYCGTADAVYRNLTAIPNLHDSLVLVLAGDHVYKMDYRPMLEAHRERGACVTVGCVEAPLEDARRFGVVALGRNDRIVRFVEKPQTLEETPHTSGVVHASMGIYVFDGALLAEILAADAACADSNHDFGADVLPKLIAAGRAYAYPMCSVDGSAPRYWRDIGTLGAYWQSHMDLLGHAPPLRLDDPRWPIGRGVAAPRIVASTGTDLGGTVENSLVPAGCKVAGRVQRSVLAAGVDVGRGARVAETVVLPGASIGAGCRLRGVIVDTGYRVPDGTVVERTDHGPPPVLSAHALDEAQQAGAR